MTSVSLQFFSILPAESPGFPSCGPLRDIWDSLRRCFRWDSAPSAAAPMAQDQRTAPGHQSPPGGTRMTSDKSLPSYRRFRSVSLFFWMYFVRQVIGCFDLESRLLRCYQCSFKQTEILIMGVWDSRSLKVANVRLMYCTSTGKASGENI